MNSNRLEALKGDREGQYSIRINRQWRNRVPANRLYQILAGKRSLTADTALRLARYFGSSPDFWMNLQSTYELDMARQRSEQVLREIPRRPQPAALT